MKPEDAEEYTQSLGQIFAGSWRQIALGKRLGVPAALGLSTEEWVTSRLGGYVKQSIPERREAALELSDSGHSVRDIAEILGVGKTTIADDVRNRTEEAEAERLAERAEGYEKQIEDGCTVEDLNLLIEQGKKFSVIYADPPWSFEVYSGKGKARSADRHYNTMSLEDIKALPIQQLANDDCALFLWSVSPDLPGALAVIEAWGFTYKTAGFVWVKENEKSPGLHWGMGYWTRANIEMCLLATRGSPKRQAKDVHQVVMSPVGEHSRKPEQVSERIERLLPGPYLELFGRRPMAGWTVWGNQIIRGLFHQNIPNIEAAE